MYISKRSRMDHQFYLQIHHACLVFVSVHQMAPPLIEAADVQLQLTTHLSTPKGWKAKLAWLLDGRFTQVVTHQRQVLRKTESSPAKDW